MASRRAAAAAVRGLRAAPAPRVCFAAATRAAATTSRTVAPRAAVVATGSLRWYSVKSRDPDAIPGSRDWDFEMVKQQAEDRSGKDVVLVDVREPLELQETGKIPGAINIPITTAIQSLHISDEDFADMYGYDRPTKDKELVFYCKAGVRAKAAAGLAKHAGWENVGVYYGSWLDWEKGGGPVERVKRGEGVQRD